MCKVPTYLPTLLEQANKQAGKQAGNVAQLDAAGRVGEQHHRGWSGVPLGNLSEDPVYGWVGMAGTEWDVSLQSPHSLISHFHSYLPTSRGHLFLLPLRPRRHLFPPATSKCRTVHGGGGGGGWWIWVGVVVVPPQGVPSLVLACAPAHWLMQAEATSPYFSGVQRDGLWSGESQPGVRAAGVWGGEDLGPLMREGGRSVLE